MMGERSTQGSTPQRRHPSRARAFGLLLIGSLTALLLAGQSWATVTGAFTVEEHLTGNDLTNAMAGLLAGAAAAGTALAALSGPRARTVLGVAITVLAIGMAAAVLGVDRSRTAADPAAGPLGVGWLGIGYLVAAGVVGAGALVLALRARTWPARADRFTRTAARSATRAEDPASEVWKALDAGFDPTAAAEERAADPARASVDEQDRPTGPAAQKNRPDDAGDTSGRKRPDRGE